MVCAVCDETGHIDERVRIPTLTPEETMPEMLAFFRDKGLSAVGIGCFGPVDLNHASPTYGYITSTPKQAWQNYPMVQAFASALGVPVGFDTDVNAAALGEAAFGCTRDVGCSLYVTVGTGVGVGVIVDGRPHHGMLHPEGGHLLLARRADDPMVGSGCPFHDNCLEGLAAGPSLEKRWGVRGAALSDRPEVWDLEAYYLGQALANYILLLSPERIVLGGGVMQQPSLLPLVRERTAAFLGGYIRTPRLRDMDSYIVGCSLNDNQGVLGALKLAMDAEREAMQ